MKGKNVNVTVENLGSCKNLIRVEVDAQTVETTENRVTSEIHQRASLPGFRPGKAPRERVIKAYAKQIREETISSLIRENVNKAIKEKELWVVSTPEIEPGDFDPGKTFQFTATFEVAPEFELPEYKGLEVLAPQAVVTQADMDRAMTILRERKASYKDVNRPAATGDFIVIHYQGLVDEKPLIELAPAAKSLNEYKNYWLKLDSQSFLPGFADQLLGSQNGDKKTVTVQFPENFMEKALCSKQATYQVEVVQIKEIVLPEVNDEFAAGYGAKNMDQLREGVKNDLQNDLNQKQRNSIRDQLLGALLKRVSVEMPESMVHAQTRNIVYNIVRENQERGVAREIIDGKKDEIYNYANANAKERVKSAFIIGKIANKEKIRASQEEIMAKIESLAQQYQMKVDRLRKQLEEKGAIDDIEEQIVFNKVLDFLQLHAKITEQTQAPTA